MLFLRSKKLVLVLPAFLTLGAVSLVPLPPYEREPPPMSSDSLDMRAFSEDPLPKELRLLFIHHSSGGQWLAAPGTDNGENCIYETAENGGGLRDALTAAGYDVHEASYKSAVGDKTDIFDWPAKFGRQMDKVLTCNRQDAFYDDGRRNDVVMFKSCFPNNVFAGRGRSPGNPRGPQLTVENAKAAYLALLPEFEKHPDTLFVAVSAPPMALGSPPLLKIVARWLLGRRRNLKPTGPYAREFNNWLKDPKSGWLSSYSGTNVVVFDLYDVLTDRGVSNFARYPTGRYSDDSHPSSEGNRRATASFVPFLNRAVRRAGLLGHATAADVEHLTTSK